MPEVKIYSTGTCPYCDQARDYLRGKGIDFTEVDVGDDLIGRQEMMSISGQIGVPVIRIGDEVIVGFNRRSIDDALERMES